MTTDDTQAPERDNDDAPSPVADWTPDCDGRVPNQRLIRLSKAFVELREGMLSEGQVVQMTGLDRITVREIDDLFNQAVTGLEDRLNAAAAAGTIIPAEPITGGGERLVYVALNGTLVEGIGATKEEARIVAVERRRYFRARRHEAGCVGVNDKREEDNDEAWSAVLTFVTLSGTVENLRLFVEGNEDLSMARPVCPRDLWSDGDLAEVKQ